MSIIAGTAILGNDLSQKLESVQIKQKRQAALASH